jgi:arylsulfatase A-like enzyme
MATRRNILQAGFATAMATSSQMGHGRSPVTIRPPNFIIILADDLGYGDIGCFGSPTIRTPRIDAMAADGAKLTCVYAEPLCGPARAAIMTGSYPIEVAEPGNVKHRHTVLHDREITIAEVLRPRGYRSAMIGKWGIGLQSNNRWKRELQPMRQGFDLFLGTPASNDMPGDVRLLGGDGEILEAPPKLETLTERYTDAAISFMRDNRDRPFFIYLCPNMPHVALAASSAFRGRSARGLFGDVVEELDHHVGRLLDAVRSLGLDEDTVILFTSDNGPWLNKGDEGGSAGPFRGGKQSTWEGGFRVPGVLKAPGRVAAGRTFTGMVGLQDMLPTLAALAGADLPKDRVLSGIDLSAYLFGTATESPRDSFAFYLWTHLQAVRKGQWKLHLPRPEDPKWKAPLTPYESLGPVDAAAIKGPMLFNVDADHAETRNVAADHPDVVAALTAFADETRARFGDYNRVGSAVRFFDPLTSRPAAPTLAVT